MKQKFSASTRLLVSILAVAGMIAVAEARNPIRNDFFSRYPAANNTQLDDLPSDGSHCGVCHFDFGGGGRRNPYGVAVEALIQLGYTNANAFAAIEGKDTDGDGFTNLEEITNAVFDNTPTFPGLYAANLGSVVNIPQAEVQPYLAPSGSADATPPAVTILSPNGGETVPAQGMLNATYTATDASGIAYVNVYLSDDGGATFKQIAGRAPAGASVAAFIPARPGAQSVLRVEAVDNAGNAGHDDSNEPFTITPPPGTAPTTLHDVDLPGTQPFKGAVLEDPSLHCVSCHGGYDPANEPWQTWRGSMMAQAARDPLFMAAVAVAEQDAPGVGDLCLRCHTPGGWQEGRSIDTSGGLLNAKDRQGVQCDFCHRLVDIEYVAGTSPPQDLEVLAGIVPLPLAFANGQFVNDTAPLLRGPFTTDAANHQFANSPLHRSSDACGFCHDVSNPVFDRTGPADYAPNAFGAEHPTMDLRDMFPVERTFSEWSASAYASTGVYAPQFAGNKPGGIVSTCQDCHMRDANAAGCNQTGAPVRPDLPLHDLMGGNTFIPDVLPALFPGEVDVAALQAAKARAVHMLQLAATLGVTPEDFGVTVRVTNETGHKLPSGYPEGRRIWLHVEARDASENVVFASGAYDPATGVLTHDDHVKIYEIHPGLSPALAGALGLPAGTSFHFVLNDTVYMDNRIPPRGFTNAGFQAVQSPPVDHAYADGQHWDDTPYFLPAASESVTVTLYYQATSKEYVEFLRDANTTNSAGQILYDAWTANGRCAPVVMARETVAVDVIALHAGDAGGRAFLLAPGRPNPFTSTTRIAYELPARSHVMLAVFDVSGRRVRTLVDAVQPADRHETVWDGKDDLGVRLAAGLYFVDLRAGGNRLTRRVVLL